jgi:hypothetical protein
MNYKLTSVKLNYILSIAVVILIFLLFNNNKKQTITIPSVSNKFEGIVPIEIKTDTLYKDSIIYKNKKVIVENPVNKDLTAKYLKALVENDSLKQLNLYLSAVQLRNYESVFEDEHIKATVYSYTTGTLDSLKLDYIRKEIKFDIPTNTFKYKVFIGGSVGINKDLNQGVLKANVGYLNSKFNTTQLEYLKLNNQNYFLIGKTFNLFTIK